MTRRYQGAQTSTVIHVNPTQFSEVNPYNYKHGVTLGKKRYSPEKQAEWAAPGKAVPENATLGHAIVQARVDRQAAEQSATAAADRVRARRERMREARESGE